MLDQILAGFTSIGQSLIKEPSTWWLLVPIFVLWVVMEIYFGEYKKEKIGWNTVLANGISFSWVNIASFRILFLENSLAVDFRLRFSILICFLLFGVFIICTAFTHRIPEKLAYPLAGPTTIYFLSMVAILWGQGVLEITPWILLDLIILYLVITLIFWLIKKKLLGMMGEVEAIKKGQSPL